MVKQIRNCHTGPALPKDSLNQIPQTPLTPNNDQFTTKNRSNLMDFEVFQQKAQNLFLFVEKSNFFPVIRLLAVPGQYIINLHIAMLRMSSGRNPSLAELSSELQILTAWLPSVLCYVGKLKLDMNDFKRMHVKSGAELSKSDNPGT